jgi:hypothetical protein
LFTPENKPGKYDGAEFHREAYRFEDIHGGHLLALTGSAADRRKTFHNYCIETAGCGYDCLAYFGHGTAGSLVHFYSVRNVKRLCADIEKPFANNVTVILYACSAGRGFSTALCDGLGDQGLDEAVVVSHSTKGHTTRNPHVRIDNEAGQYALFTPRSKLWRKWQTWLKKDNNRFWFPFMDKASILEELGSNYKDTASMPESVKNQW